MQHFKICDSPVGQGDQRRMHQRYATVVQSVTIISENNEEVCNMRQVTSGCAVADVSGNYRPNDVVILALSQSKTVKANVTWALNKSIGLKFYRPDDLAVILLGQAAKSLQLKRHHLDFLAEGSVAIGDEVRNALIEDISQKGIRVLCGIELQIGLTVVMHILGLASKSSTVCWSNDGITGLSFDSEIDLKSLRQWLNAHRHPQSF